MFVVQIFQSNRLKLIFPKRAIILLFLFGLGSYSIKAQNPLKRRISLEISNKSLEEAVLDIQNHHGIAFSYSKNIIRLDKMITCNYQNVALDEVLDGLFSNSDVVYKFKAGMIVLQPKPQNMDKLILTGTVKSMDNGLPLEFAGIQLKNSGKGGITDKNGNFSFQVKRSELNDSIEVSSLGYMKASYLAAGFTEGSGHVVYLKLKMINLQAVNIHAKDFKIKKIGNHSILSFGSIYMDTQGQQTALFIANKKGKKGIISSVSYYLSDKGNVQSPFRVRIYEKDSISGKPGKDLLKEMLVARPKESGWFSVDISQFNIGIPKDGFFVAIEGIYPNEYGKVQAEGNEDLPEDGFPNTISYGQRLGYSKKKGENTWHYSLAHTWFQLKESNFHVMISAKIQYRKKKGMRT
jgi:hypothetical protein